MNKGTIQLSVFLLIAATVFFIKPVIAESADKLIVRDSSGTIRYSVTDQGDLGIYDDAGNQKAIITSEGKLGMGTSNPLAQVYAVDNTGSQPPSPDRGIIAAQHNDGVHSPVIKFRKSRGTEENPTTLIEDDYIGIFMGWGHDGTQYLRPAQFGFRTDGPVTTGEIPTAIMFYTGKGAPDLYERMRISSDGNVGFGLNNPTHLIHLAGGAYSDGATWVNGSSRELKENIREVSAEEAIQTVKNLQPVAFSYKRGNNEQHVGFIAEDVPELVATADRKSLSSMDIVAVLTKVVQEQQKTMQLLQKTVQEQQAKIGCLETALEFKEDKVVNVTQVKVVQDLQKHD